MNVSLGKDPRIYSPVNLSYRKLLLRQSLCDLSSSFLALLHEE